MWCLWNGEYGEHELSNVLGLDGIVKMQEEQYKRNIGCVVGDFTCEKVEYDWGRRDQRWTVRCNLCGRIVYQYHTQDWRRGKGRKIYCDCRAEQKRKVEEDARNERLEKISQKQKEHLGKVYGGWKVAEYGGRENCKIECSVCGIKRKESVRIADVIDGNITPCSHKKPNDYSGNEWIGQRAGHLVAVGRDGSMFRCKCDCGREISERPTILFTRKTRTTCGSPECEYSTKAQREARKRKTEGHDFEKQTEEMLRSLGYNAKRTKCASDFGVDIIITEDDGTKIAVQCKKSDAAAGISAVQEVYAGGVFYGCKKFSVICNKGFSNPAIIMARKLGVYLCEKDFAFPSDVGEYANDLLPVYHANKNLEKTYELNGVRHTLADWCALCGANQNSVRDNLNRGMSFQMALYFWQENQKKDEITVAGVTGNLTQVCNHFGILPQTVMYRMKYNGMSVEEAIFFKGNRRGNDPYEQTKLSLE